MVKLFGQEKLKTELYYISQDISKNINHNILLQGRSGYGKTTFAIYTAELANKDYVVILGDKPIKTSSVMIIDEAHLMRTPETLYHIMDKRLYTIFLLTTEIGDLPEPLVNRCMSLYIEEYTEKDLKNMAKHFLKINDDKILEEIVNRSRGVPRVVKTLIERLKVYYRNSGKHPSLDFTIDVLNTFGVYRDGFTDVDYKYLELLENNKAVSLKTLSKYLGVPTNTIENYIEPFLLRNNLIQITSKGRILNEI